MSDETIETCEKKTSPMKLAVAAIAAVVGLSLACYQYIQMPPAGSAPMGHRFAKVESKLRQTDEGRQLLWARGEGETGEWFDITDSPLKPDGYQYGIGKDTIPSIDEPKFVAIRERDTLLQRGISDETRIIGYAHNGEAKAYPIGILNRHELVNDMVGGKPVTVGW